MEMRNTRLVFPNLSEVRSHIGSAAHSSGASISEIEAARERARQEGFARGREEGLAAAQTEIARLTEQARNDGFAAGVLEGRTAVAQAAAALEAAAHRLDELHASLRQEVEQFAVELTIATVHSLTSVKLRRQFLVQAIQSACESLKPAEPAAIWLNPRDARLVAKALSGASIRESASIAPGAFQVEAGSLFVEGSLDEALAAVEQKLRQQSGRLHHDGGEHR